MGVPEAIFTATDLTVGYKQERPLLKGLQLSLMTGKLVCLMGPNGAGKSTLIRTLAGLQPALHGRLSHQNEKHLSVVLTDKVNSTHMTAGELITLGRYPHLGWTVSLGDHDRQVIRDVVAQVRIVDLMEKKLFELSDGQMQMVMIARALIQDTPVILLDEPTAHLDLNNRLEIMNLLRSLTRESNKAILVSTHELDLALQTADEVWLTDQGKIRRGIPEDLVLNGSFDEVFQFKGFDLKTGKVQHTAFRKRAVRLEGEGHTLLWTRNALERNGFEILQQGEVTIIVRDKQWQLGDWHFYSLAEVVNYLISG